MSSFELYEYTYLIFYAFHSSNFEAFVFVFYFIFSYRFSLIIIKPFYIYSIF